MKKDDIKLAAGIVVYNPDEKRLDTCLGELLKQVDKVYIFDNGDCGDQLARFDGIIYITEHENKGIPYALNRIMGAAKNDGYDWVITMDQDSIIPDGMVVKYEDAIKNNEELGIVCPQVVDCRRSYMEVKKEPKQEFVDFCITSASCTSIEVWDKVGKFDEWLFIDLVDNEFCKRLTVSGYKILRLNELVLNQEFGNIIPRGEKIQKFWIRVSKLLHNQNFAKFSYRKFVSPMRVYYTCRNIIYVNKKLKDYGPIGYRENYNCNGYMGFVISFIVLSILRSQDKVKVLKAAIEGTREGRKVKPKKWIINDER